MGRSPGLTLQASIVQDNVPVEIAPRVFVGSVHAAFNIDVLKEMRISHIVNLAGTYATFPEDFAYLSINIRDKEYANVLSCLPVALLFVDAALAEHNKDDDDEERGVLIHCAGGRSRSPAVAIAYLMINFKLQFEDALLRIRTARPIVSLNAGFETQLRLLEKANGDVLAAHQLLLQTRLTTIMQERDDGLLGVDGTNKNHKARHASRHRHVARTPTADDQLQEFHGATSAACDDRGMIHGTVPSGCSLSLPQHAAKGQQFIPALRSMGTLYGCRACGENLFSASAIIDQCQSTNRRPPVDPVVTPSSSSLPTSLEVKTKRPLLAKLRLRPQSPSVKGTPPSATATGVSKSNPSTPRLTVLKSGKTPHDKLSYPMSPQCLYQQQQQLQQHSPVPFELAKSGSTSDLTLGLRPKDESSRTNSGSFWRSLTNFKSSTKRPGHESEDDKKKKNGVVSPKAIAIDLSTTDHDTHDATFLTENAQQWQRQLSQLEQSWAGEPSSTKKKTTSTTETLSAQLSAVVAHDVSTMACLEAPAVWCVAPPPWLLDANLQDAKGAIVCPNVLCGVTLGQWQWDGSIACTCGCGHVVCPAFAVEKSALRKLGLVVAPPAVPGDTSLYNSGGKCEPLTQKRTMHK